VSELPDRVRRAFDSHGSFEPTADGTAGGAGAASYRDVTSPFDASVTAFADPSSVPGSDGTAADPDAGTEPGPIQEAPDGAVGYRVRFEAPTLAAVAADEVAPVVDDGWFDTFRRRVADVGAVTRADHDLAPSVTRAGETVSVTVAYDDLDPTRAADDAAAFVDFLEGTYLQGVVPGYEYDDPVASLLHEARQRGTESETDSGTDGTTNDDSDGTTSSLRGGGSLRGN
jgi:hypothetical protein